MVDPYLSFRERMVGEQIERRGLRSAHLLEAFRKVPRHVFIPEDCQKFAYDDRPLPIGQGQTISQPYIVALMTNLLQLDGDETVLEIGTGSGYQAAILAELAGTVHTIERQEILAERAQQILAGLGYANIFCHTGDGSLGWPGGAPYNGILITAAAPSPPQPLLDQLADGGRLVLPVADHNGQDLQVWERHGIRLEPESIIPVSFVPLRGEFGWKDDEWDEANGFFYT
jgi:protein-L-isoaspartate(D-aspartate) O-methyltransferase